MILTVRFTNIVWTSREASITFGEAEREARFSLCERPSVTRITKGEARTLGARSSLLALRETFGDPKPLVKGNLC